MNKLLILILIDLIFSSNLFGQDEKDLIKILDSRDFVAFQNYANNFLKRQNGIDLDKEYLRDLTAEFEEGIYVFQKHIPSQDNPGRSTVYTFKVNLITTKTTIIYYEFKGLGHFEKYKNDSAFNNLKISFKDIYQSDINENELFIIDFVYGSNCGIAGEDPAGQQQINAWVASKNKAELLKWLKSTNTEKQVYAVEGLFKLKEVGVELTDKEMKIINFVCNKKGTLYVCSGCIHSREEIRSVTKYFKQ